MNVLLEKIGNWNPQLFRELRGRLKWRNLFFAAVLSIIGQLVVLGSYMNNLPQLPYSITGQYCLEKVNIVPVEQQRNILNGQLFEMKSGRFNSKTADFIQFEPGTSNQQKKKIVEQKIKELDKIIYQKCPISKIDYQQWWKDNWAKIFMGLTVSGFVVLLTGGSFMLLSDLHDEELKGTLNFIRLSPQSSFSIFLGKILGVPAILYGAGLVALPFHLYAGLSAKMPLGEIFSYYLVLLGSCAFFYSGALLFGSMTSWLKGFQPWLGSGLVLLFLAVVLKQQIDQSPADFLTLFSPKIILPYLIDIAGSNGYYEMPFRMGLIKNLQWFYLPVGMTGFGILIFSLLNYGLWTYWISQALKRKFYSQDATMFSKRQSYLVTACFALEIVGLACQMPKQNYSSQYINNLQIGGTLIFLFLLIIVAALSPSRQTLQEWARYKHFAKSQKSGTKFSMMPDLIWGEKSPATVAILINILIAMTPIAGWIFLWNTAYQPKENGLLGIIFLSTLLLFCAALMQRILLIKHPKRTLLAASALFGLLFVHPIASSIGFSPFQRTGYGLITIWPWDAIREVGLSQIFAVLAVEMSAIGFLMWQLNKQLKTMGESATKIALAAKRN